jgi:hypothetical protein
VKLWRVGTRKVVWRCEPYALKAVVELGREAVEMRIEGS